MLIIYDENVKVYRVICKERHVRAKRIHLIDTVVSSKIRIGKYAAIYHVYKEFNLAICLSRRTSRGGLSNEYITLGEGETSPLQRRVIDITLRNTETPIIAVDM